VFIEDHVKIPVENQKMLKKIILMIMLFSLILNSDQLTLLSPHQAQVQDQAHHLVNVLVNLVEISVLAVMLLVLLLVLVEKLLNVYHMELIVYKLVLMKLNV
jgi:flagellar biosynthesis protein FlhB